MVVQSVEELRRRVQEGWRLTRDRKGFKIRGLEAPEGQEGLQDEGAGREVGEGLKGP